jgi:RNA polymerase-associated protein RTF1
MDESDSDDDAQRSRADAAGGGGGDDEDDNRYPVEGMYASHAEKAKIMGMGELEREQIIAERVNEIERQRQNRLLRQMVENEERKQVKKKRSADTAELEDASSPRTSRQRTTGGKGESAMETLRRARAEKQKRREDQERRRDAYSPRRGGSMDRESERSFGRAESRSPEPEPERDIPPPDLRDFDRVRLGRNEFAQVCFTPGFEAAITGCYIRIALGPHPDTGVEQYRMAVIKGMFDVIRCFTGLTWI